ncbi:hypothetical protein CgunFtcFv8_025150 [Champsocephalus gunnari]|uniref:Integrase p58-like C-terminal domain-containing protein n=1 Tax=Champsocephalus gunnari TaxID=52237 RepID=A0AAN8DGL3_CHAGU|nr:hypothetical protein CgunFtcFv8_025150 [Champsocephalus gunnari]
MACRSAVQESSACSPALLMLGRELRTPAVLAFGQPPDSLDTPPGPEYARRLQDRLDSAHAFARDQQKSAGVRQKRNYDTRTRGQHFRAGELVWVYSPQRKKGRCPKLDSQWVGPCRVLERVGEVVYRVQLPPKGRKVVLHRDRLAPYRGVASPQAEPQGTSGPTAVPSTPPLRSPGEQSSSPPSGTECPLIVSPPGPEPATPVLLTPVPLPRRQVRPPGRFRDFVW